MAPSKKKNNFSAATLRGLGCTSGASQQVSVPAVIRDSLLLRLVREENKKKEAQENGQQWQEQDFSVGF